MITIINDDDDRRASTIRSNLRIKEHHEVRGQGSWPRGARGQNLKKGGVRGGSQKSPNFAHGGGKFGGGCFWGGPRKQGS